MLTIVYANNIMLYILYAPSKRSPIRIIRFVLKISNNEQHPYKCVIVDEDGTLENSIDVTNLLVDEIKMFMKTSGGDAS